MSNFTVKKIEDMEAVFYGAFKRARAELGIESFGMQVIDMPANAEQYPEHDHAKDGQEEAYVVLSGGGEIEIEGERHAVDPETMVRVGSGVSRKVWPGDEGMRVLIIGGVPGKVYEAPDVTQLGAPDPAAAQPA
ncbi:MAG: hypothetical protein QOG09_242 [Solirubrobacterales bacterium]|jgi:mannose-6-phosphate isomerase-like protein (cupin superfamily)|nr:hypothetical protein [Solirubrobacterales bacterium]MDX6651421.1 hypothetical protein [Solirubrobacterales bacterium]MDX6662140.1 hypothetical protein [Solirubrobacterales bacterium]